MSYARIRTQVASWGMPYNGMSRVERMLLVRRLAFMVRSGMPLHDALHTLHDQTTSSAHAVALRGVTDSIGAGKPLHVGLQQYIPNLGTFALNVVRVGEYAGALGENLSYLADELAKRHALAQKVRGALVYPALVCGATCATVALMVLYIFPRVVPVFISLGVPLPLSTRILIDVSTWLAAWWMPVTGALIVLLLGFIYARIHVASVAYLFDRTVLTLPVVGSLIRAHTTANLCRTLRLLLRSGVHVVDALMVTADATENRAYRRALMRVAHDVRSGTTITASMRREHSLIDAMVPHMIHVGESTGALTDVLGSLADYFENDLDIRTKNLTSVIEPLLLILMGLIVGLVAISIITPIYDVTKNLNGRP